MTVNIPLFRMPSATQGKYGRYWIEKRSGKSLRKIGRRPSANARALASAAVTIPGRKAKAKSGIPIGTLNEDHVTNVVHVIHVIPGDPLGETAVDQKTAFPPKNTNTAEKIIFVLNAVTQIIQLKTANSHSTQIGHL